MLTLVNDTSDQQFLSPPKRRSDSQPRRSDYNRRRFLAWLRDEITILRALGMDHRRIAAQLDIEEHDVRVFSPKPKEKILCRNLPRRAIDALLHGRHASLGGRTVAKRSRHLVKIASAYTWEELMAEPGVGTVTASEIRLWLEERGAALRPSPDGAANWYRSTPTPDIS
ncbi:hypothetical protein [Nitrobacter winogradskyi]|uniref:Uncharacterized protein n=2 Tax=Nitrobacter winogradskyi TaxID=913 RepID=A0ACC6AJ49_NITWI|nr:hypothetical protein [Nitrobacter winogradskyi]MCP1999696.1 hypothetical protein [Nitrobacter winogradskyi]GEC15802.1 hypothetical protein NWI01_16940 [Nitrobacter winogradskyi]